MNDISLAISRNMFHLQVYEADGQRFEDLFTKIKSYKHHDFQPVKAYGNIGDRKNDGMIESEKTYFQVYAPENINKSINQAVSKLREDFLGLYEHWNHLCEIKKFYFVLNEKYKGAPPQLHQELLKIKHEFGLDEAKVFVAKDLEFDLFSLSEDLILSVVGHIPHINSQEYMFVSGFTCFITAWIDFEKLARAKTNEIDFQIRPIVGHQLIRKLHTLKLITYDDLIQLEAIAKQRNKLVHGDSLVIPKKQEIDKLIAITERLNIRSQQEHVPLI